MPYKRVIIVLLHHCQNTSETYPLIMLQRKFLWLFRARTWSDCSNEIRLYYQTAPQTSFLTNQPHQYGIFILTTQCNISLEVSLKQMYNHTPSLR
jgi:hypothetical protein